MITQRNHRAGSDGGSIALKAYAGLLQVDTDAYRSPILAASTDGVGLKQVIAQQTGMLGTIGLDVVAMVADDIVCCGARPLFLLANLRTGEMRPDAINAIIDGVREGCDIVGCSLTDHEVARSPERRDDEFDLSASGVGIVEAEDLLGSDRVEPGDVLIAIGSSGLHSNGFGIVRSAVLGSGRARLDARIDELDGERTLGEVLLTPTRIYAPDALALIARCEVNALAHITGGGLPGNLSRILPEHADAIVDRSTWAPDPIFGFVSEKGRIYPDEMERSFNMGVGMVAVVPPAAADRAIAILTELGHRAWYLGVVTKGDGHVRLINEYAPS
jgi:phosphoribosylformylglycinamidine cyclo-ligase